MTSDAQAQNSIAKSRSETASREFFRHRLEAERARHALAIDGEGVPARAAAPSGSRLVRRRQSARRSRSRSSIAHVGEQVMAEGHRLRHLQVRVAGHDERGVALRLVEQRALQREQSARSRRSRRAATGARRSPPGRCASARCAAACRHRRPAR
jgi:hypothetical protein